MCDPTDTSPPGSPVPGILQARTLGWVAISFSNAWKWNMKVKSLSRVQLFATPWTAAYQAPLSVGFSRPEYWSGVPEGILGIIKYMWDVLWSKFSQIAPKPKVSLSLHFFIATNLSYFFVATAGDHHKGLMRVGFLPKTLFPGYTAISHFIFSGSPAGASITQELGEPILCTVENLPPYQQFLCIRDSASSDSTTSKLNICCLVAKLCLTLCDPMDRSPPGSSVHGISQARILEWVAISFSRGSSRPRDGIRVSCFGRWIL